jgi:hypothetical protein
MLSKVFFENTFEVWNGSKGNENDTDGPAIYGH